MPDVNPTNPRRATLRQERAEATRQRIADAARRRFSRDGYAAVTIRDIAAEAGVAVQTVYAVYGSKAGILAALRAAAMHQPEAVAAFAAAMEAGPPDARLRGFASSIRQRWERAGDIVLIHRDAAAADPSVRVEVEQTLAARREGIMALARSLAPRLPRRTSVERATAILDALSLPEVYLELTAVAAWSPDEFETWLGDSLVDQLLALPRHAR